MAVNIKFGTDGWRAIIAKEYTVDNVMRVAKATAEWIKASGLNKSVVIGHDCRFGGNMFANVTAQVIAAEGIKVFLADKYASTPMISLAAVKQQAGAGIVITASHNPPSYNGFKIKAHYGGPADPVDIEKIENLIPETYLGTLTDIEDLIKSGQVELIDMQAMYKTQMEEGFDLATIKKSGLEIAYDAMYGAGQGIMREVFPEANFLHAEDNPGFDGQAPEPIDKNLQELSQLISMSEEIDMGLATDGDADRIGLYNDKGEFIDSHHIILLLINYLHKHKGMSGSVVKSFSCTSKIDKMCNIFGLESITTKIGFKYICKHMVESDVLVGGEESGGIAIKGHIPERDGIWIGLVIWEYMAKTGKSLNELIQEVYDIVGSFAVERYDLHIKEEQKQSIIAACKAGNYSSFGSYTIEKTEDTDGFKYHLGNEEWVLIRPSGTEPVLRVYAESSTKNNAIKILEATKAAILA